jgi:hypothetical protein
MKKILLPILFLLICSIGISQQFDVREAKWGMSSREVIDSEYPNRGIVDGSEIEFNHVDLGNGLKAKLLYFFDRDELNEVRYIVYGKNTIATCESIIPLAQKVKECNFLIDKFKLNGYECNMGWYFGNKPVSLSEITGDRSYYYNCKTDLSTISLVNKIAKENKATRVMINLENERSSVSFEFNEHQNEIKKEYKDIPKEFLMKCSDDFYNTRFWLRIKPVY